MRSFADTGRFVRGPVLGIETSADHPGAALVRDGRPLAEMSIDYRAGAAEQLPELIRRILDANGVTPGELGRVGVSIGPGSFTGLRIGLATARGLAWGAGVPLVAVSSHEVLAWPWRDEGRSIVLLSGLRRERLFFEAGRWDHDVWVGRMGVRQLALPEVAGAVRQIAGDGPLRFVGESVHSVLTAVPELGRLGHPSTDPLADVRRPAVVALLAARVGARETAGKAMEVLEPLYLREADARRPSPSPAPGRGEGRA